MESALRNIILVCKQTHDIPGNITFFTGIKDRLSRGDSIVTPTIVFIIRPVPPYAGNIVCIQCKLCGIRDPIITVIKAVLNAIVIESDCSAI